MWAVVHLHATNYTHTSTRTKEKTRRRKKQQKHFKIKWKTLLAHTQTTEQWIQLIISGNPYRDQNHKQRIHNNGLVHVFIFILFRFKLLLNITEQFGWPFYSARANHANQCHSFSAKRNSSSIWDVNYESSQPASHSLTLLYYIFHLHYYANSPNSHDRARTAIQTLTLSHWNRKEARAGVRIWIWIWILYSWQIIQQNEKESKSCFYQLNQHELHFFRRIKARARNKTGTHCEAERIQMANPESKINGMTMQWAKAQQIEKNVDKRKRAKMYLTREKNKSVW